MDIEIVGMDEWDDCENCESDSPIMVAVLDEDGDPAQQCPECGMLQWTYMTIIPSSQHE